MQRETPSASAASRAITSSASSNTRVEVRASPISRNARSWRFCSSRRRNACALLMAMAACTASCPNSVRSAAEKRRSSRVSTRPSTPITRSPYTSGVSIVVWKPHLSNDARSVGGRSGSSQCSSMVRRPSMTASMLSQSSRSAVSPTASPYGFSAAAHQVATKVMCRAPDSYSQMSQEKTPIASPIWRATVARMSSAARLDASVALTSARMRCALSTAPPR
jgi:hypothetical protein